MMCLQNYKIYRVPYAAHTRWLHSFESIEVDYTITCFLRMHEND